MDPGACFLVVGGGPMTSLKDGTVAGAPAVGMGACILLATVGACRQRSLDMP